jgi:DNA mismatch repair protein MutH
MNRHLHVHIPERQYTLLRNESALTGLPMAELVRRALDFTYVPDARRRVRGWQWSIGWWRHPDAVATGRRAGTR